MNLFNLFKKKSNKVRFINPIPGLAAAHPIIEAQDLKREWMERNAKDMALQKEMLKTCPMDKIKGLVMSTGFIIRCPGIRTVQNTGYIVPLPYDVVIETYGDGEKFNTVFFVPDNAAYKTSIDYHPKEQYHNYIPVPDNTLKTLIKIGTGWNIVPDENYVWMFCPVLHSGETRFTVATGIVDPYLDPQINAQLFWHVLKGRTFIKAGTPLLQIIPLPRNFVQPEFECGMGNITDFNKLLGNFNANKVSSNRDYRKLNESGQRLWNDPTT